MNKENLFKILEIGIISMITGYGMFWYYEINSIFSIFTNMMIGMFVSALMGSFLTFVLFAKELSSDSKVKNKKTCTK